MKFDWQIMRPTVVWVTAALVLSLLLVGVSFYEYSSASDAYAFQQSALSSAQQRSIKMSDDLNVLQNSLPVFRKMIAKGLIGEEHRLDWVETLREAASDLKLNKFEYRISEQKEFEGKEYPIEGGYKILTSDMHVNMQLLHEGDFIKIMEKLRNKAEGLFQIKECQFQRISKSLVIDSKTPNINADCDIQWFSIQYEHMSEGAQA